jgi:hypothetical protein
LRGGLGATGATGVTGVTGVPWHRINISPLKVRTDDECVMSGISYPDGHTSPARA